MSRGVTFKGNPLTLAGSEVKSMREFEEMMECLDLKLTVRLISRPAEDEEDAVEDDEDEESNGVRGPVIEFNFGEGDEEQEREDDREREDGDRLDRIPGFEPLGGGGGFGLGF